MEGVTQHDVLGPTKGSVPPRELEAAGVLSRLPLHHNTRAYALTERGADLRGAITALGRWGEERTSS